MNKLTAPYRLILASNSPRRSELLAGLELDFEVKTIPDIDESFPAHLRGEAIALHITQQKAAAYLPTIQEAELIITADTIVCVGDSVLGKPQDEAQAVEMLTQLSGNTHTVITAVSLMTNTKQHCFSTTTEVTFAPLTGEEITHYVVHYRPFDKAGGYGIQEWIGYIGVESINGSYFNVMGLPVQRLYRELRTFCAQPSELPHSR